MTTGVSESWLLANQRYLTAALAIVQAALKRHATASAPDRAAGEQDAGASLPLHELAAAMPALPALETLCRAFALSAFERDVLLLCAGVELDATFAPLCAAAQGDPQRAYPTFGLALAALPDPHWSALTPAAPLRRWRLIEVGPGSALTASPLRIDERVLHYLAGIQHLDERLVGMVEPLDAASSMVPSHRELAEQIATIWAQSAEGYLPAVQLCGAELADQRAIAAAACAMVGLGVCALQAQAIPLPHGDLVQLARLWEREAALSDRALLLECDDLESPDAAREHAFDRLIASVGGPLIVAGRQRRSLRQRSVISFDVPRATSAEQRAIWHDVLSGAAHALNGHVDALASQFNLGAHAIRSVSAEVLGRVGDTRLASGDSPDPGLQSLISDLWNTCRAAVRPHLDDLAQRIEPAAAWDDLVLPAAQRQTLREIAVHLRQRARVYEQWGFAAKGARGLGISALFAGGSGTGKTLAAEVLANELRLDLYRIDLSAVVSKYIGETEKNLRCVFDAAEAGGAILLFDEADALFGKRSEVKDSHDRYANIEVAYLLQRMEAYRGLAILTTNMKDALDGAFLRRIRFVVQFPFPDAEQRAEIWRRIFPCETPTEGLDARKLAQLNVAGGTIRNIALHAAFLAADEGAAVQMPHLLRAARGEYARLEKLLSAVEMKDWT